VNRALKLDIWCSCKEFILYFIYNDFDLKKLRDPNFLLKIFNGMINITFQSSSDI